MITKADLAEAVGFDEAAADANIQAVRPGMEIVRVSAKTGVGMEDYLDLLENSADALILGQIYFLRIVQGNRDAALATIKLYDETLFGGGHPGVLLQKAEGYQRTSAYPPSAWSDTEVFEAARRIMAWTPYQAYASAWAAHNWYQGAQRVAMSRGYPALLSQVAEPGDQQPLARDWPAREAFLVKLTHGVDATSKPAIKDACS